VNRKEEEAIAAMQEPGFLKNARPRQLSQIGEVHRTHGSLQHIDETIELTRRFPVVTVIRATMFAISVAVVAVIATAIAITMLFVRRTLLGSGVASCGGEDRR
jgi:hypothetical protein